jgi:hypothetical protein
MFARLRAAVQDWDVPRFTFVSRKLAQSAITTLKKCICARFSPSSTIKFARRACRLLTTQCLPPYPIPVEQHFIRVSVFHVAERELERCVEASTMRFIYLWDPPPSHETPGY